MIKMKAILLGILFICNSLQICGQSCYELLLKEVQVSLEKKNFKTAIQQLENPTCTKLSNDQTTKIHALLSSTNKAYIQELETALSESKKITEAIYYYNNKLALAAKEVDGKLKYGYINKRGDVLIDFLYDEAVMFDEDISYAKVKKDKKYYYLDTLGRELLMAESIQEMTRETEVLDLSRQGLKTLPENLRIYTKLKILNLYDNEFYSLPSWLSELKHLEEVYLGYNTFTEIPEAILMLKNLKKLDLYDNEIALITSSITKLPLLQELSFSLNPLETVPEELGTLKYLQQLHLINTPISSNEETKAVIKAWLPNCLIRW